MHNGQIHAIIAFGKEDMLPALFRNEFIMINGINNKIIHETNNDNII